MNIKLNEGKGKKLYPHKIFLLRVSYAIFRMKFVQCKFLWSKHVRVKHIYTNILIYDRNSFHFHFHCALTFHLRIFVCFWVRTCQVHTTATWHIMNTEHFKAYDSFRYANGMRARVCANNFVRFWYIWTGKEVAGNVQYDLNMITHHRCLMERNKFY